jgi:hypothetical protein
MTKVRRIVFWKNCDNHHGEKEIIEFPAETTDIMIEEAYNEWIDQHGGWYDLDDPENEQQNKH